MGILKPLTQVNESRIAVWNDPKTVDTFLNADSVDITDMNTRGEESSIRCFSIQIYDNLSLKHSNLHQITALLTGKA